MPSEYSHLGAMSLAVVGARHPNKDDSNRRFELRLCKPGEPVELVREPTNEFDERAVAAFSCRGVQIGYLRAERAGGIERMIRGGRELRAVFQRETDFGAWIRVAFDGDQPVVDTSEPQAPVAGTEEQDFYPDEEWPDG
jgi:hypothetical protein